MNIRFVYKNKKTDKITFKYASILSLAKKKLPATKSTEQLIAINKSTGLTDKNGKEIFEGDIFLTYSGTYSEYSHHRPSFIYFDDHYSAFKLHADEDEDGLDLNKFVYKEHLSVAGNVYENESLLLVVEGEGDGAVTLGEDYVELAQEMSEKSLLNK